MWAYAVRGFDEKFHHKVRRPICPTESYDCFVIELTFGEIKEAVENANHELRKYVDELALKAYWWFYSELERITPDHITLDDRIFIVFEDPDDWRGPTYTYILFRHYEHCGTLELVRVLLELRNLCDLTGCDAVGLEEMSCSDEYILFEVKYGTLDRYVNNALYKANNPWRRLIVAYLQDYYVKHVGEFLNSS